MSVDVIYQISSTAAGGGRDGEVVSESGRIDLALRPPTEMGGSGDGTNPEELFSAGYAGCFLGALRATAQQDGKPVPEESTVAVKVGIGKDTEDGGFGLTADIEVFIPGFSEADAQAAADRAHAFCPYSKATKGNIAHNVTVRV